MRTAAIGLVITVMAFVFPPDISAAPIAAIFGAILTGIGTGLALVQDWKEAGQ